MNRPTRRGFESLAVSALIAGVIQFVLDIDMEIATYGFEWAVYGTGAAVAFGLASIFIISRLGFRPAAYVWLFLLAFALAVTGYDFAVGNLPQLDYAFAMLSVALDVAASFYLIFWLRADRKGNSDNA